MSLRTADNTFWRLAGRARSVPLSAVVIPLAVLVMPPVACKRGQSGGVPPGVVQLRAWAHAGREGERKTIERQVQAFNDKGEGAQVDLTLLPEGEYNAQVRAAALADALPDVLEFDGPFVYNYVWQGHLIPLDEYLPKTLRDDLLGSILAQGTYRGKLWSLGQYDSGLALFARRSKLESVDARIPKRPDEAWTIDEFEGILSRLARRDADGAVLDLKLNYSGEWFTYGFSPALWSAGGGLIDREDDQSAKGVLNGTDAVSAMARIQSWIVEKKFVDPNIDDYAFLDGRVALSWVGHWEFVRYSEAFGDDLVVIPLPDFAAGSRTGQGSWNWGITTNCADPKAAMSFITHLLADQQVLEMTSQNHAVPATRSAASKSDLHREGGPLHLYVVQLSQGYAVPRPRTPAYPVITSLFQQAFDDIRHGADVSAVLDRTAAEIDRDIADNDGYSFQPEQKP